MKMRKLCFILLIMSAMLCLTGCKPGTGDTIILVGDESGFKSLQDLMTPDLEPATQNAFLEAMKSYSGSLPDGVYPPDIMGEYKISNKQYLASNIGFDLFDDGQDVLLRVFNQYNRMAKVDFSEGGVSRIDDAYITGSGNQFTLYFTEERDIEIMNEIYHYNRLIVITGTIVNDGIRELYFGNIILNVINGQNPLVGNFKPGWYFLYKDEDGLSDQGQWF